jgi:hypothetical protein
LQDSIGKKIPLATFGAVYVAFFIAMIAGTDKELPAIMPEVLSPLVSGNDQAFLPVGYEFEPFRKMLPARGRLGFIMDYPFHPYGQTITQLYSAQTYFVPVVFNPEPGDPVALLYCSNRFIADRRMAETGYRLAAVLADGKGFAAKKT